MFDWIASKVAVTFAGFAILFSSLGMLVVLHQGYETVEVRDVADSVTHAINQLSGVSAETVVNFTYGVAVGVHLPKAIRGEHYDFEFFGTAIFLHRSGFTAISRFSERIHLWNPGDLRQATHAQVELADRHITTWTIPSSMDFQAVRRYVEGIGYMTFVIHPETEEMQEYLETELIPEIDQGETSPGTNRVTVPARYDAYVLPGMVVLEGLTGNETGLRVCGFTKAEHLWKPSGDRYNTTQLEENDASNPGPLDVNTFTVEWVIVKRTNHPCGTCESGYQATPEGFMYA